MDNLEDYLIEGAVVPGSMALMYRFPYKALTEAKERIFNNNIENSKFLPEDDITYKSLRLLLSYQHERTHLRHLCSSPFGFFLWLLQNRDYERTAMTFKKWGERQNGLKSSIPIFSKHIDEIEIQKLATLKDCTNETTLLFKSKKNVSLQDVTQSIKWGFDEVESFSENKIGYPIPFPLLDIKEDSYYKTISMICNGNQLIEGLARANDYLLAISYGASNNTLNRLFLDLDTTPYGNIKAIVEKAFKIEVPHSLHMVAHLVDWSLQAPLLPWLVYDQYMLSILEIFPSWRFPLLLSRCLEAKITVEDLHNNALEIENDIFKSLGWISPTEIAHRMLKVNFSELNGFAASWVITKLIKGAKIRLDSPKSLIYPDQSNEIDILESGLSLFADDILIISPELQSKKNWYELPKTLFDHILLDSLWAGPNLDNAYYFANLFAENIFRTSGLKMLQSTMIEIFGQDTARKILLSD